MAKEKKENPAKGLLEALKFIKPCQKKTGTLEQTHCMLMNKWMVASNGILTIATPIKEDLWACPHTGKFEEALKKVGEDLSITQLSDEAISIVSGDMKAVVPCHPKAFDIPGPDPQQFLADNRLRDAIKVLEPIVQDGAKKASYGSVFIWGSRAVATNGHVILEMDHGTSNPLRAMVPKAAAKAVGKCKKELVGLGFTGPSMTFWFEDNSFIKTQLFNEEYLNYETPLDRASKGAMWTVTENFFKGIEFMAKITEDKLAYFGEGKFKANGSSYAFDDFPLPVGMGVNVDYMKMIKPCFELVNFNEQSNAIYFKGKESRGMLMGVTKETEV